MPVANAHLYVDRPVERERELALLEAAFALIGSPLSRPSLCYVTRTGPNQAIVPSRFTPASG